MEQFYNAKNRARTVLTKDVSPIGSKIYVADVSVFPEPPFVVTIDDEIMLVVSKNSTNKTLGVVRGYEGTTPKVHYKGASVENRFTAGTIQKIYEDVTKLKTYNISTLKKCLWWYAYPSSINGVWDTKKAGEIFGQYDIVVFPRDVVDGNGDGWADDTHYDANRVPLIIQYAQEINNNFEPYGYITLMDLVTKGIEQVQSLIDAWKSKGVKGIFWDEFGFDYFAVRAGITDHKVARQWQNTAMQMTHDAGLIAMVNAWNIDDVFSTENNTIDEIEWWAGYDGYLYENIPFYASSSGTTEWASAGDIWYKAYRINNTYSNYKVRMFGVATMHDDVINDAIKYQTYCNIALGMAYSIGLEGLGIERDNYHASDPNLLPPWTDLINYYRTIQPGVYSYYTNQTYVSSSGNTYNNLVKYVQNWQGGQTIAYYTSDERTPIAYIFNPYFMWETDGVAVFYKIDKMLNTIFEYSSSGLTIKFGTSKVTIKPDGTITVG